MMLIVDEYINCIAIPDEVNAIISKPWRIADSMNLWGHTFDLTHSFSIIIVGQLTNIITYINIFSQSTD